MATKLPDNSWVYLGWIAAALFAMAVAGPIAAGIVVVILAIYMAPWPPGSRDDSSEGKTDVDP